MAVEKRDATQVVAVIQARMGSSRLPGKSLLSIGGVPLLQHIFIRLAQSKCITKTIVATSTDPSDDAIESFCVTNDIRVVRGPIDNVLARYRMALEGTGAEYVVRVNGDAPFVDSSVVDRLVDLLQNEHMDLSRPDPATPCIHQGFSVFSMRAFDKLWNEARTDPVAMEHITGYFKEHPGFVSTTQFSYEDAECFQGARLSVDTPSDVEFVETVYQRLGAPVPHATIPSLVELLRQDPTLLSINGDVHQKGLTEQERRVIVRTDGGGHLGFGHLARTLILANAMRNEYGAAVTFAMKPNPRAEAAVQEQKFRFRSIDERNEASSLAALIEEINPHAVVYDIQTNLTRVEVREATALGARTIGIDDDSERRLAYDVNVYSPGPQVARNDWSQYDGTVLFGWEYAITDPSLGHRLHYPENERFKLFVATDGNDAKGVVFGVVDGLKQVRADFEATIVVGTDFASLDELKLAIVDMPHCKVVEGGDGLYPYLKDADLGVIAFGVTAFELARVGVPALHICHDEDAAQSAMMFEKAQISISLGIFNKVASAAQIGKQVTELMVHSYKLKAMAHNTKDLHVGEGLHVLCERILG